MRRFVGMVAALVGMVAATGSPGSADGGGGAWASQFGTTRLDEIKAVAVDGLGAIYVAGETFGSLPGQKPGGTLDAVVRKYGPGGQEIWTRQFGAWERDIAWGVATDRLGAAYVVGQTEGTLPGQRSAGGWDAFIRKYDSSGREIWIRQFGGGGADIASDVAVDGAGNLYVVGTTSSALSGQPSAGSFDAFIRRYSAAGDEVWTHQFGTSASDNARRVALDADGRVLLVGSTEGALPGASSAGGYDAFLATFRADGRPVWTRQFGTTGDDFGVAIGADRGGNISVAGSAGEALSGRTSGAVFLRRFDVTGTVLWTDQFGAGRADEAWDVAVESGGAAHLVGTTEHALSGQRSAGRLDVFVRKYGPDGQRLWTRQFGTPEDDHALAGALTDRGVVLAGSTRGALADRSAGDLDAFVLHLTGPER